MCHNYVRLLVLLAAMYLIESYVIIWPSLENEL